MPDYHAPVLLDALLERFPRVERMVDCTLGDGGHAGTFRDAGARVLGIDQDPVALERARARLGTERIEYWPGNAYDDATLERIEAFGPDLILIDLGVSSRQLDDDRLGFSYRPGVPLDMRMAGAGPTAADLLAEASEQELTRWLAEYGDEPKARRVAGTIVRRRGTAPLLTSDDLVNAIRSALGARSGPADFARIFQAVRIAVNDELAGLEAALPRLRDALVPGGALAAISYHSGEDRLVKHAFREWSTACLCPPAQPVCTCRGKPLGRLVTRKPILADEAEVAANPRARSAKLRIFQVSSDDGATR
ncbi:MAG: 16S rRNA (cytosine(1402)-N(4))-methyltransferase RsmH [Gemmatimonadales bacterium]|nr:16S rRNA (cytosine(1402)-N(4))-methyltransferase RsmH [Gemmatimonadales bacterium]